MKSGIELSRYDPFGIGTIGLENPDCVCGSQLKGDPNCLDSNIEECIFYSDSQLEDIILNGDFCDGYGDEVYQLMKELEQLEADRQDLMEYTDNNNSNIISDNDVQQDNNVVPLIPVLIEQDFDHIANYVEVETSDNDKVDTSTTTTTTSTSIASSPAYSIENSLLSPASSTTTTKSVVIQPKKTASTKQRSNHKRPKRIHDDRVKLQNKIAAIKYRKRKKEEQGELDEQIHIEEVKNKQLKSDVKELKIQIKIIKELVNKYLADKLKQ